MHRRPPATIESSRSFAAPAAALCIATLSFASAVVSQPRAGGDSSNGAVLLERFLSEVQTLEADFDQQLLTADDRLIEQASGSLILSRPNRFRWRYEMPYEQLIVADAENLWIYDVELEQVTVTAMDETAASSPAMLLSGDEAVREGFTVVDSFERDGLGWVRLEPELEGTDFTSVLIGFDGTSPQRLELVDGLGQTTRIEFSNIDINPELDEDVFEFDVPRGVDVIGTPG